MEREDMPSILNEELVRVNTKLKELAEEVKIDKQSSSISFLDREPHKLQTDVRGTILDDEMEKMTEKLKSLEAEVKQRDEKITVLEEELYMRDEEILNAKVVLLKIYPQLNLDDNLDDESDIDRREMGLLNLEDFSVLFPSFSYDDEEAQMHYMQWAMSVDDEQLAQLRTDYGENFYHRFRKVLLEIKVGLRHKVSLKPWNFSERREATIWELLLRIPDIAPILQKRRES
ncbi:hypothetical protein EUTSA_v10019666mg [Eutrema salsugineum]|uniref:Factor of DNA methylation 1-5/IDN2 domain-containing protein n=1 Tax=Eutrema salsugineum TaxID=72664 RepID=V4KIS0_EUTSA|nr:hypothetical protein EUTSA_v10019666mg [Eutrema salsugineum]